MLVLCTDRSRLWDLVSFYVDPIPRLFHSNSEELEALSRQVDGRLGSKQAGSALLDVGNGMRCVLMQEKLTGTHNQQWTL